MKRLWIMGVGLLLSVSGCGEELLVKLSQAVTPATPTEAKQELAAALDALSVMDDFSELAPVSFKTNAGTSFASRGAALATKLSMQQDDFPAISINGDSITIDCELGGSITLSGGSSTADGDGKLTVRADNCRESNGDGTTTLQDGTVKIQVESSGDPNGSNFHIRMTMTIRGTFQDFDADGNLIAREVADLETTWDGKMDTTALEDAVSSLDTTEVTEEDLDAFESDLNAAIQYRITIDGGLELEDVSEPCASGVYAFDTAEPLLFDLTGSGCGYSEGILKINGVTYSFDVSTVTVSGPGYEDVVSCAELRSNDICEAAGEVTDTP